MFGVNVAKSSLHLHFLKTLEFRTDVSVTSTILHGDPRSETQSNSGSSEIRRASASLEFMSAS
uniref:Uncharacterized protein n=1 Tax=Monodon monoceros TaxID=40151 RepID=A0A8C6F2U0_MONMO